MTFRLFRPGGAERAAAFLAAILIAVIMTGCALSHEVAVARDGGPVDSDVETCEVATPANCRATARVPAGFFVLGDPRGHHDEPSSGTIDASPAFAAELSADVWVSSYLVTNSCWTLCLLAGSCPVADEAAGFEVVTDPTSRPIHRIPEFSARAAQLTLPGAERYCSWLGGRLVREAEWMKMARGDDGRVLPWDAGPQSPYDENFIPQAASVMEVAGGSWRAFFDRQVADVGLNERDRGPYGHYDVAGLIAEWTADAALPYDVSMSIDPYLTYDASCTASECPWHVVVADWSRDTSETPDVRWRSRGSNVDLDDRNYSGPRIPSGFGARCVFQEEPPPLCVARP